jgi:rhamnogalacturonan hydrolase
VATQVSVKRGSFAVQLDGLITLTADGSFSGNAFLFNIVSDVEFFSSNGQGAINGQGWIERISGAGQNARLVRFLNSENISFHDIILVDSPTFHLIFQGISNLEAYHVTIRGPDVGGTDGIDLTCTDNCYIHDCEVTNRDECVSVKSPSQNVLIEDMYCNHSGGMSIGSVTSNSMFSNESKNNEILNDHSIVADDATGAEVSNITMRNIYSFQCTQMLMIKTYPGGNGSRGYVKDSLFENFWSYDSTYGLGNEPVILPGMSIN